jgi:hypothetical protein
MIGAMSAKAEQRAEAEKGYSAGSSGQETGGFAERPVKRPVKRMLRPAGAGLVSVFALIAGVFFSSPSRADDLPVVNVNNEIGIAFQNLWQWYNETYQGAQLDKETGSIPGFDAKFSVMRDIWGISNVYAAVRYAYSSGTVTYNGALLSGQPYVGNSGATINDVEVELGKGFLINPDLLITPLIEGGYRDWQRDVQGPGGYNEDYSNGYIGVGVRGDLALNDRLVLTGKLGLAATLGPSMTASGGALAAEGLPPTTYSLGNTGLFQVGVGADYLLADRIHLYGGLDYSHFGFGASNVNEFGLFEPSSTTSDFTIRIGFAFGF